MKKRIFSLVLALVMVMSMSAVVFAADDTDDDKWSENGVTVGGDGSSEYLADKISLVLPTSAKFDFTLDPSGVLSLAAGGDAVDKSTLEGGKILGEAPVAIINNSSLPAEVTVTAKIAVQGTGMAIMSDAASVDAVPASGKTVADASGEGNVFMYIVPSSVNVAKAEDVDTNDKFTGSEKGFVLGASDITLKFALPAATYEVKNTGSESSPVYVQTLKAGTGSGTAFMLGGKCNTKADWSTYDKGTVDAAVTALFKVDQDTATHQASDYDVTSGTPAAKFLLTPTATAVVADLGTVAGPKFGAASYTTTQLSTATVTMTIVDLDKLTSGTSTTPTAMTFSNGAAVSGPFTSGSNCTWSVSNNVGTLKTTAGKTFHNAANPTGTYTVSVTFGSGASAKTVTTTVVVS